MPIVNAYDNAAALCEACILWKAGILPPSLEHLFYEVLRSICYMGTALLVKEPAYRKRTLEWQQPDVQSLLLAHLLTKIKSTELKTDEPKQVVNLLLRATQNRLRDLHGYQERRKNFVTTTTANPDISGLQAADMAGQVRARPLNPKVSTDRRKKDLD